MNVGIGLGVGYNSMVGAGGPYFRTESILGEGGLDYALYDSSALDRMWQEATGQTPANANSPVGLIVGREKQQAKTFAQVMAGQPELRGGGSPVSAGTPSVPATYNPANGVGTAQRDSGTNQSYVSFPTPAGRLIAIDVQNTGVNAVQIRASSGVVLASIAAGIRFQGIVPNDTSATSLRAGADAQAISFTVFSIKEVPAHYASQAVGGSRPALQADGLKFDGSDDNLLTDWFAQVGANCIIAQVSVPAVLASNQVIAGASSTERAFLGVNTNGRISGGVGAQTFGTIEGTIDRRGQTVVVALTFDGTTVQIFDDSAGLVYSAAQSGATLTSIAMALGAAKTSSSTNSYFSGSEKRVALGKVIPTPTQFQQIRAEWLAAA